MDINFFYARHRHRLIRLYLKAFLLDLGEFQYRMLSVPDFCELGTWFRESAMIDTKDTTVMKRFSELHKSLNEQIYAVIALKNEGKIDESFNQFKSVDKMTEEIINIINTVEKKAVIYQPIQIDKLKA